MSVILDGVNDYLSRSLSGVTLTNQRTFCTWIRFDSAMTQEWKNIYYIAGGDGGQAHYTDLNYWYGAGGTDYAASLAQNTWYHFGFVRNGFNLLMTINGVQVYNASTGENPWNGSDLDLGAWGRSGDWHASRYAYTRWWNTNLSVAQLAAEMASATAVVTTSLFGSWSFATDLSDQSGNGRTFTFNFGTDTYGAQPSLGGATTSRVWRPRRNIVLPKRGYF